MNLNIKKISSLVLPMLLSAGMVFAAPPKNIGGFVDLMWNIVHWIFAFFLIFAAIYIIIAAFTYLTAQGDPEKIRTAKMQLIYAIIAIVIAALSEAIIAALGNIVGFTIKIQ